MILTTLTDEEIEKTEPMLFDLAFDFQMDYGVDIKRSSEKIKTNLNIGWEHYRSIIMLRKEGIVL